MMRTIDFLGLAAVVVMSLQLALLAYLIWCERTGR